MLLERKMLDRFFHQERDHYSFADDFGNINSPKNNFSSRTDLCIVNKPIEKLKVSIEEINGDLYDGVVTKQYKEVSYIPTIYNKPNKIQKNNNFKSLSCCKYIQNNVSLGDKVNTFVLEYVCDKKEDITLGLWRVYNNHNVIVIDEKIDSIFIKDMLKVKHTFFIALNQREDDAYFQLRCSSEGILRCRSKTFENGDIITIFFKDSVHYPSTYHVGTHNDIYVPVKIGQKTQIEINDRTHYLNYDVSDKAPVIFVNYKDFYNSDSLSTKIHIFQCVKKIAKQYEINVRDLSKSRHVTSSVYFPHIDLDKFVTVYRNSGNFQIYSHGIKGIKLITKRDRNLHISEGVKARFVCKSVNKHQSEIQVIFDEFGLFSFKDGMYSWMLTN